MHSIDVADQQEVTEMMLWYDHALGGWGFAGMALSMVMFSALIVAGVVALVHFADDDQPRTHAAPTSQPSAQQLLGIRFARGEIDDNEYREKLAILRDHFAT